MPQIELPSGSFHYDEFGSGEELLWLTRRRRGRRRVASRTRCPTSSASTAT